MTLPSRRSMMDRLRGVRLTAGCGLGMLVVASHCGVQAQGVKLIRLRAPGGGLQAYIAPAHGADLAGLEVRRAGRWSELLYRGMDYRPTDGWTGKAPILWPAVVHAAQAAANASGGGAGRQRIEDQVKKSDLDGINQQLSMLLDEVVDNDAAPTPTVVHAANQLRASSGKARDTLTGMLAGGSYQMSSSSPD